MFYTNLMGLNPEMQCRAIWRKRQSPGADERNPATYGT